VLAKRHDAWKDYCIPFFLNVHARLLNHASDKQSRQKNSKSWALICFWSAAKSHCMGYPHIAVGPESACRIMNVSFLFSPVFDNSPEPLHFSNDSRGSLSFYVAGLSLWNSLYRQAFIYCQQSEQDINNCFFTTCIHVTAQDCVAVVVQVSKTVEPKCLRL